MAEGKVAMVTGAARRLGRSMALQLAQDGFAVVVHYRSSASDAREVVREIRRIGPRAEAIRADLSSVAEIEGLFGSVGELFGRLDVLVNNASTFRRTPLMTVEEADFDEMVDSNLKAPFFCAQFAAALMRVHDEGQIINMVDESAHDPWEHYLPYCAAKAGLISLTRGLAKALAPKIRVNAIAPGPVLLPEGASPAERERAIDSTPLQRIGSADDIRAALHFLVCGSDYLTGAVLPIDGGRFLAARR